MSVAEDGSDAPEIVSSGSLWGALVPGRKPVAGRVGRCTAPGPTDDSRRFRRPKPRSALEKAGTFAGTFRKTPANGWDVSRDVLLSTGVRGVYVCLGATRDRRCRGVARTSSAHCAVGRRCPAAQLTFVGESALQSGDDDHRCLTSVADRATPYAVDVPPPSDSGRALCRADVIAGEVLAGPRKRSSHIC